MANEVALKNIDFGRGVVPRDFEDVMRFAGLIFASNLAPKNFDNAQKVAVGIMMNMELGRPVVLGLQDLAIINGRCGIYGGGKLALITASGLMEPGYPREVETGTPFADDWTFAFTVKRKGGTEQTDRFSWADAKRAGNDNPKKRDGSKDTYSPWVRYPRRMMQWKARAWILDDVFGDVTKGIRSVEELQDYKEEPLFIAEAEVVKLDFDKDFLPELLKEYTQEKLDAFLSACASGGKTVEEIKGNAVNDQDAFRKALAGWKAPEEKQSLFDRVMSMRGQFEGFTRGNIKKIAELTEEEQAKIKEKWIAKDIGPWPLDPVEEDPADGEVVDAEFDNTKFEEEMEFFGAELSSFARFMDNNGYSSISSVPADEQDSVLAAMKAALDQQNEG